MKSTDARTLSLEEKNLELDFSDLSDDPGPAFPLDRREFLKLVGGGILVFCTVPRSLAVQEGGRGRGQQLPQDFNAFLRIGEDGRVTGFTGKIEMGQGIITSLAQMLADELDVSLDSVHMVMGDTDLCPWDRGTFGSMTTRFFGPPFRAAAAEAKAVLVDLAAEKLGVPKDRLKTRDGAVYEVGGGKKVSYAELTQGKKILRHVKGAPVETPADFTIVGKPVLRKDSVEKVSGRAKFSGDLKEPGMLCARILRPPAHGAKLVSADTSAAREMDGSSGSGPGISVWGSASPAPRPAALGQGQCLFDQPRAVLVQVLVLEVLQVADELQRRVVHALELLALLGLDEDALRLGVADLAGIGVGKPGQDRDGDGAHGGDGQVGADPIGAVLAHDGHAVALLDVARRQGPGHVLHLLLQLQVDVGWPVVPDV